MGVCAAGAFEVRDVLFPHIGSQAAPSLWGSPDTVPAAPVLVDVTRAADGPQPSDAAPVAPSSSAPAVEVDDSVPTSSGQHPRPVRVASESPSRPASGDGTVTSSPGESSGGSPSPTTSVPSREQVPPVPVLTSTTVSPSSVPGHSAGGGSGASGGGAVTTTSSPSVPVTTVSVTTTSSPGTGGTLPGGSGHGGSGSGHGGDVHDSIP